MSYTKFVTSVLFICCLTGFYLVSNNVRASEPELYFYPEQKWSVARVNPSDNTLPICSISNQLNNGYVVEMSGDAKGFSTLNIDFRQNAFQIGLKYEVQLLVPGISRIVVPAKATTKTTITSDLTEHLAFANEMRNSGVMDIQIRENEFRLYLTGLKSKMPAYNECTGNTNSADIALNNNNDNSNITVATPMPSENLLNSAPLNASEEYVPPQPQSVAGVAPPPPPVPTIIENDNILAMDAASKARPIANEEPRYIDVLAEKLKRDSSNYQPAERVNKNDAVGSTAASAPSNSSSVVSAEPIKTSHVTTENFKSPKFVRNVTRDVVPSVIDLTSSNNSSSDALASADIEPASGVTSAQAANLDGAGFVDMRNKISSLEKEIKLLNDKNLMLDEELKIALKDSEDERISVSSDNWNLERATMRYNEAERQIQRISRQLQTQRAQCELEKTDLENMLFDPKLTSQQQLTKFSSMEAELDRTKSDMFRQQRQYEEKIKILEQQLNAQ
jgi:hypothetical protein